MKYFLCKNVTKVSLHKKNAVIRIVFYASMPLNMFRVFASSCELMQSQIYFLMMTLLTCFLL